MTEFFNKSLSDYSCHQFLNILKLSVVLAKRPLNVRVGSRLRNEVKVNVYSGH